MLKLKTIGAAALAAALAIIVMPAAEAITTCHVPTEYATIQLAVSTGTCEVIAVAPGTYNENVTVNRSVTINGAQAGNRFDQRAPGGESVVNGVTPSGGVAVFQIDASDVTIDGFTIKNAVNSGAAYGVAVRAGGNDAAILNNIFDGINTPDPGGNGTAQAVYLTAGGPDNVNIQDNEMKNIHSNRSAKGVLLGDNGGTDPSQNVQVKGNSMHDITSDTRGAYGVSVANVGGGGTTGLKVLANDINNLNGVGWVHGVGLEGNTPGVIVMDNSFSALNTGALDRTAVWFEANPSFAGAIVQNNNFDVTPAAFGIAVQPSLVTANPSGTVSGTCNWWGSPSGPTAASNPGGTGAQVSAGVTYNPWLIAPSPSGNCFGGNVPTTAAQCKNGGWMTSTRSNGSTFKNQGDCMQYVNTGK